MNEPKIVNSEEELLEHYEDGGQAWMVVIGGDRWPYLMSCSEEGDVFFQTFPTEDEEGDAFAGKPVNSGTLWPHEVSSSFYPARVVAAG